MVGGQNPESIEECPAAIVAEGDQTKGTLVRNVYQIASDNLRAGTKVVFRCGIAASFSRERLGRNTDAQ